MISPSVCPWLWILCSMVGDPNYIYLLLDCIASHCLSLESNLVMWFPCHLLLLQGLWQSDLYSLRNLNFNFWIIQALKDNLQYFKMKFLVQPMWKAKPKVAILYSTTLDMLQTINGPYFLLSINENKQTIFKNYSSNAVSMNLSNSLFTFCWSL